VVGEIRLLTAEPSELGGDMQLRGQMNVKDVVGSIRDIMWRNVSVVREEKSLREPLNLALKLFFTEKDSLLKRCF